jgi:hypothetical protein
MDDCPRCHGLIVREDIHPAYDGRTEEPLTLLRCINCGFRWDELICFHRLLRTMEAPQERMKPLNVRSCDSTPHDIQEYETCRTVRLALQIKSAP